MQGSDAIYLVCTKLLILSKYVSPSTSQPPYTSSVSINFHEAYLHSEHQVVSIQAETKKTLSKFYHEYYGNNYFFSGLVSKL